MTKAPASLLEVAMPDVDEAQSLDMRQIASGQQLAQARSASGLSAEALAERLRLSPEQVLALDAERWDQLPDLTFVRAVLRAYARQINVDASPLIEHVGGFAQATVLQPYAADVRAADAGRRRVAAHGWRDYLPKRIWPLALGSLVGLVVLAGVVVLLMAGAGPAARTVQTVPIPGVSQNPMRKAPALDQQAPSGLRGLQSRDALAPVGALPVTIRASGSMMTLRELPVTAAAKPAELSRQSTASAAAARQPAADAAPVSLTSFPVQMPESEPVHVHIKKRSWLEITHKDGVQLLAGTKDGNQSFRLDGTPPMDVQVGNPAGVEIEFRGKRVDLQSKINSKGTVHFTLN